MGLCRPRGSGREMIPARSNNPTCRILTSHPQSQIGTPRSTFLSMSAIQYLTGGPERHWTIRSPRPDRVLRNRIPDDVRSRIVTLALDQSGALATGTGRALYKTTSRALLSCRKGSAHRLLKAHEPDLCASPAFITMKSSGGTSSRTRATAPNQLWQTEALLI